MPKITFSAKRLQINKENTRTVAAISLAAILTTFSLVASNALLSQRSYQARVISEKEKAARQLEDNLENIKNLRDSYLVFVGTVQNIIGGDPKLNGDRNGDNAKIILDALPSKYDFPALASSLEKLLDERNFGVESIAGTDDELSQTSQTSPSPLAVEIPFELTVNSNYNSLKSLIEVFELSIRPMHITALTLSGNNEATRLSISAKTYYQPAKNLDITTKEIK